jgi:two-component system sensor histidine kinase PilS (NtrC family)
MHQCQNCKILTIQDISEVERLEQQMRQTEKLAAIGRISAGIAHDFRNPLAAISGSAQVLADEFSHHDSPEQRTNRVLINIILRESNRLTRTISDFLKFARPESAEREWFSLRKCVDEVIQVSQADPLWPATCTLQVEIDPRYSLWADQHQIFTVLSQLVHNALPFCPPGAEVIRIEAEELNLSETQGEIILRVADNGTGIEEENRDKIFEPFFTRRVDGTGLGLAIVKQIVRAHHGTIEVGRSELGGALFTVHLPLP